MSSLYRLRRSLLLAVAFGVAVGFLLVAYGDLKATVGLLTSFPWRLLPLLFILVLTNYALRFVKWEFYLRTIGVRLPLRGSAVVFLAGFTMAVTPGKFGEVLKSFLVKELTGTEVSRTAPVVMAERLTDVLGLVLLASLGATSFRFGGAVLLVATVGALAIVGIAQSRGMALTLLGWAEGWVFVGRLVPRLRLFYDSSYTLLRLRNLVPTTLLSVVSWFFECLAFWLVLRGLDLPFSVFASTFTYAFASLVGALSMLPGGLGIAEGSMTGLLQLLGAPKAEAVTATLLVRLVTLWFAVLLGVVALSWGFSRLPRHPSPKLGSPPADR